MLRDGIERTAAAPDSRSPPDGKDAIMTRRWLVSVSALLMTIWLAAAAIGQAPSSLADRIKQLRREWTEPDDVEPTPADGYTAVAPPRAGSAQAGTSTTGHGGLPQIEPRSLMPQSLLSRPDVEFGGGSQPNTTRTVTRPLSSPSAVASRPIARKSPTTAPSASPTPVYSTARRSPAQRTYVDVNPDELHDELTGTAHAPAATHAESKSSEASPTILDDFAAGLAKEGTTAAPAKTTPPAVSADPTSKSALAPSPIALPSSTEPIPPRSQTKAVLTDRKADSELNRYGEPTFPSANNEHQDSTPSDATVGHGFAGKTPETSDAAKAFQFESRPSPGSSSTSGPGASNSSNSLPIAPRDALTGAAAQTRRESFIPGDPDPTAAAGVLVTNAAPAITSDIRGPKQIAIGRQASYRVRLQNQGGSSADAVVATVRIPSWAEVVNTSASNGVVRQIAADDAAATLQWQISRLDAQAAETLTIALVPRASRPLELAVTWTHGPAYARTVVEVQEPKLKLEVTGPDEVLFNKSNVYRLTLSNPGTGVAENVKINLLPPGGGSQAVSTFQVGDLAPGVSKTAEVELTAREAGKLSVQAVAIADGDLKSEAVKELFCRKPELEVDWRGPDTQYAGTAATYFFRVRNPGTAAADDVAVKVALPTGAEFVSASEGNAYDSTKREVAWRVGSLGPGDDCYMELRCKVSTPGENKIAVTAATAAGDLVDNKVATTNVVALADLKLDVSDPPGPVAVGQEAIYEIRVTNRGASAAEEVNVVGLFSAGLEPETGEGAPYTVSDGRVAFRTINKLPAGQDIVLQIRAKATEPGTHVFRAEVLCRDLEIKLASEETTRFYEDEVSRSSAGDAPTAVGAKYEQAAH
jgi:uncharacterized repeat protein (TIGR01451 family)